MSACNLQGDFSLWEPAKELAGFIANFANKSHAQWESRHPVSYWYLFRSFLKIGATSFGGFVALVSVIQDQLVERDKCLDPQVILDGISLASVLPGPLAVNVTTYVGYTLRGIAGGLICMTAVLLPSFALVVGLSAFYFQYGDLPALSRIFQGILPAVSAIIIVVAIRMGKKAIQDRWQALIALAAAAVLLWVGGFITTLLIILAGGVLGLLLYGKPEEPKTKAKAPSGIRSYLSLIPPIGLFAAAMLLLVLVAIWLPDWPLISKLRDLALTFSGMSLSLFGGGYVMIPAMHGIIVEQLQWLNTQEFADGIAMGQFTPGPILISAAFVGYKLAGISGALVATVCIFFPPAMAMLVASRFLAGIKGHPAVVAVFKGLRPAVIGMIASAAYTLVRDVQLSWVTALIFGLVLLLALRFKVNVVYLIPMAGVMGWLLL